METNQKCECGLCYQCHSQEERNTLTNASSEVLENPNVVIVTHPQEEKEWANTLWRLIYAWKEAEPAEMRAKSDTVESFIREQKHLSYQAGLKFAMGKIEELREAEVERANVGKATFYNAGMEDLSRALTSELDKEVN